MKKLTITLRNDDDSEIIRESDVALLFEPCIEEMMSTLTSVHGVDAKTEVQNILKASIHDSMDALIDAWWSEIIR